MSPDGTPPRSSRPPASGTRDDAPGLPGPAPGAGPIDDRLRRRVLWALTTGLYVVGSRDGDRRNLMTANLVTQVATEPKLVAVAVEAEAVTSGLVARGGRFAVTMLGRDDRAVVRRFAKPVVDVELGVDGRAVTMAGEAVVETPGGVPVLARGVAWLDCEVRHHLPLGSHDLFVGEVVAVAGPDGELPPLLRMEDTRMNYGG